MKYVVIFFILALALGGGWAVYSRMQAAAAQSAPVQATETVIRTTIEKLVAANGNIASNRDVDIKCQASGLVEVLPYNDINAQIKPGEVVCKLNPKDEQPLLDNAKAVVEADKARLKEANLNWEIAKKTLLTQTSRNQAALKTAQARAAQAAAKAKRTEDLFSQKLESQEDLEADQTAAIQSQADVQTAQAAIDELEQQKSAIDVKEQTIHEMEAAAAQDLSRLKQAQDGVDYCTVYAPPATDPADPPRWVISSLLTNIAPGYIVQSGTSGFSAGTTIMTLSDLSHIYMLAAVNESDIGQVGDPAITKEGQKVRVTVDAYQGEIFEGVVTRVAPKGVNTNNVVTFEVKIEITGPNRMLLRPAMTATAKIVCASHADVLAIPASAFVATPRTRGEAATTPGAEPSTASRPGRRGSRRGGGDQGTEAGAPPRAGMPQEGTVDVIKPDKSTETRNVTVGLTDGAYYEVIQGLQEGETVVINKAAPDSKWAGRNQTGSFIPRGMGGR